MTFSLLLLHLSQNKLVLQTIQFLRSLRNFVNLKVFIHSQKKYRKLFDNNLDELNTSMLLKFL